MTILHIRQGALEDGRYSIRLTLKRQGQPDLPATGTFPSDGNNIAPRIGLAFDPAGDGRTVIRAGAGVYYNVLVAQTYNNFLRGNGRDVININVTPTTAGAPAFSRGKVTPRAVSR